MQAQNPGMEAGGHKLVTLFASTLRVGGISFALTPLLLLGVFGAYSLGQGHDHS